MSRVSSVFRRRHDEASLEHEIQAHLELLTEEYVARGLTREDARQAARREFGGVSQIKERHRDQRGLPSIESVVHDVRYAARTLAKTPGFTVVTILTLAVAIGANSSIFTLINALLLRELPVRDPQGLVQVSMVDQRGQQRALSLRLFDEIERRQRVFSGSFVWLGGAVRQVEVDGQFAPTDVAAVPGNFYLELGQSPLMGRLLTDRDQEDVAVVSYGFWQRRLGGESAVTGREIRIEGRPFTVVGVTRRGFGGLALGEGAEVTIPLTSYPRVIATPDRPPIDVRQLSAGMAARLKAGTSLGQARAQLESVWPDVLQASLPAGFVGEERSAFLALRIQLTSAATGIEWFLRFHFTRPLYILCGIVGLILLIACVHLASLMLARAVARGHELALRLALGGSRWRIARQLITESLLLSLAGAALGLWLAQWSNELLIRFMTQQYLVLPVIDLQPDGSVLVVTAALATLAGVLFALVSVRFAVQRDPAIALQQRTRSLAGSTGKIGKTLVVLQVALSLVVLTGASLLARSVGNARSADPGFRKTGILIVRFMPQPGGYSGLDANSYYRDLVDRVTSLPGVRSAGLSNAQPANADPPLDQIRRTSTAIDLTEGPTAIRAGISAGFLNTMGISLLQGRDFQWSDDNRQPRVVIISQNLAVRLFASADPVGQRIRIGTDPARQNAEIVGVAADTRLFDVRQAPPFIVYLPSTQNPASFRPGHLAIHAIGDSRALRQAIAREVDALGREYVLRTRTLGEINDQRLVVEHMTARIAGFFAGVALLLASIGLYGLLSYAVTRRTREIGIRMALGAERRLVMWDIVKDALMLVSLGVAIGVPCALAATRLIAGMLFGLGPWDPVTLAAVTITLLCVGAVAALIPARRASRLDPMIALRCE